MADSNKVDINFSAETNKASGDVKKFKGEIEAIGPSGKKAAASISGSFKTIESSIGKVKKALGALSFGAMMIESVVNLVNMFRAWREEIRKTQVEAQKLNNAAVFAEQTRGVDALTDRYRNLTEAIQAAGKAAQENERVASAALDAQRKQEDAQLALREEQEVAALDRSDPAYSAKVAQIRQRYALARSALGAGRAEEDAAAKLKSYESEAFDEDVHAATYSRSAAYAKSQESEMRRKAELWGRLALYGKQRGKEGWIDRIAGTARSGKMLSNFFKAGGDQSFMKAVAGMTPEEIAEYAAEQQKMFEGKATKAGESAKTFEGEAAESAAKSRTAAALAMSQEGVIAAARTKRLAVGVAGETSAADSAGAVEAAEKADAERKEAEAKKVREKEAEEARLASALAAAPQLAAERDRIAGLIAAEQEKKAAAGMSVYNAQGTYDAARLGGNRTEQQSAFSNLQSAQDAAQNVNHAADMAINALTETLRSVETRLKAAQNEIQKQSKQERYAWSEAPSGE